MNGWVALDRFLGTDARDVGCDEAIAVLHLYAELVMAGHDPGQDYPGVVAHLNACGPCAEDFAGLLAAMGGDSSPSTSIT